MAKSKTTTTAKNDKEKKAAPQKQERNPSILTMARKSSNTTLTRIKKRIKSFETSAERTISRNQYRAKGLLGPLAG